MNGSPTLELRDIRKSVGEFQVSHGADLEIQDGEFGVFVGPSGSGKSTFLRPIAGLEDLSQGEVPINGRGANGVPSSKRGFSMVFPSSTYPNRI